MEFYSIGVYVFCCLLILDFQFVTSASHNCPKPVIPNGRARIRSRGQRAQFRCLHGFTRVGAKMAICLKSNQWSQKMPMCVGQGCPPLTFPSVLSANRLYRGGMIHFTCAAGYLRHGPEQIYCKRDKWNAEPPVCKPGISLGCDFEQEGLCGWSQVQNGDKLDWIRHKSATPTKGTGPQVDHTTGTAEGYYLFMESSAPSRTGHNAMLISPYYDPPAVVGACLEFFYHIFGADTAGDMGSLEVYIKPQIVPLARLHTDRRVKFIFQQNSSQGDQWRRHHFEIPVINQPFQIVFEGRKQESWLSDISIDDIRLYNCSEEATTAQPTTTGTNPTTTTITSTDFVPETTTTTTTTTTTPSTITGKPTTTVTTTSTPPTVQTTRVTTTTTAVPTTQRQTSSSTPKPAMRTTTIRRPKTTTSATTTAVKTTTTAESTTTAMMETTTTGSPPRGITTRTTGSFGTSKITDDTETSSGTKTQSRLNTEKTAGSTKLTTDTVPFTDGATSPKVFEPSRKGDSSQKPALSPHSSPDSTKMLPVRDTAKNTDEATATTKSTDDTTRSTVKTGSVVDASSPSTNSSQKLLPLILGVVAAVLLVALVVAALAYKWSSKKRMKEEKEVEDQMNIISDYVETSLSH